MKKMYVLVLLAIGFAGMCMAQDDVVTAVTINNWDGSPKSPDEPLYIGVGVLLVAAFLVCFYSIRKKDE